MRLLDRVLRRTPEVVVGGVYSIAGEQGFGIVKVLVTDANIIHITLYKNKFADRPASIDPSVLSVGTMNDSDGFGSLHIPLSRETFLNWQPRLIVKSDVSEEELEGYLYWKDDGGGVWQ